MKLNTKDTILYGYTERSNKEDYKREGYAEIKYACLYPSKLYNGLKLDDEPDYLVGGSELLAKLSELAGRDKYAHLVVYFYNLKLDASYMRAIARQKNNVCMSYSDYYNLLPILQMFRKINADATDNNQDGMDGLSWKLSDPKKTLIKPDEYIKVSGKKYYRTVKGYMELFQLLANAWVDMVNDMGTLYESLYVADSFNVIHFRDCLKFYDVKIGQLAEQAKISTYRDELNEPVSHGDGWMPSDKELAEYAGNVKILQVVTDKYIKKSTNWEINAKRKPSLRMTRSAYAYHKLRSLLYINNTKNLKESERMFDSAFPSLEVGTWENLRPALLGGLVYIRPHNGRYLDVGEGMVVDNNSEYSAAMCSNWYPCGKPELAAGDMHDAIRDDQVKHMYIQAFTAEFKLKPDGIPMISKEYSKDHTPVMSNRDLQEFQKTLVLCDVDFKLFEENYNITSINYLYYYRFATIAYPFKAYIERAAEEKINAARMISKYQKEGNDELVAFWTEIKRENKIDINAIPGKFSQKTLNRVTKIKTDSYGESELECEKGYTLSASNYLPIAIWTNAYARRILFEGIHSVGDRFLYCDTDSVHFTGQDIPEALACFIDQSKLGYWKIESKYRRARYLREKCYAEDMEKLDKKGDVIYEVEAKISGLSDTSKKTEIKKIEDLKYTDEREKYKNNIVVLPVSGGLVLESEARDLLPRHEAKHQLLDCEKWLGILSGFLSEHVDKLQDETWAFEWKTSNEQEERLIESIVGYYRVMVERLDNLINIAGIMKARELVNQDLSEPDGISYLEVEHKRVPYITLKNYQIQMSRLVHIAMRNLQA